MNPETCGAFRKYEMLYTKKYLQYTETLSPHIRNADLIHMIIQYIEAPIGFRAEYLYEKEIVWSCLSLNPAAVPLLEANPDKIDWPCLSLNPAAIHLLEANPDRIDWCNLSWNPAAIHLFLKYPNRFFKNIFRLPGIFTTDKNILAKCRSMIVLKN